jgi:hypothetical protein
MVLMATMMVLDVRTGTEGETKMEEKEKVVKEEKEKAVKEEKEKAVKEEKEKAVKERLLEETQRN